MILVGNPHGESGLKLWPLKRNRGTPPDSKSDGHDRIMGIAMWVCSPCGFNIMIMWVYNDNYVYPPLYNDISGI